MPINFFAPYLPPTPIALLALLAFIGLCYSRYLDIKKKDIEIQLLKKGLAEEKPISGLPTNFYRFILGNAGAAVIPFIKIFYRLLSPLDAKQTQLLDLVKSKFIEKVNAVPADDLFFFSLGMQYSVIVAFLLKITVVGLLVVWFSRRKGSLIRCFSCGLLIALSIEVILRLAKEKLTEELISVL